MLAELRSGVDEGSEGALVLGRIAAFHGPGTGFGHRARTRRGRGQAAPEHKKLGVPKLLFDSGTQSPDALRRGRELIKER